MAGSAESEFEELRASRRDHSREQLRLLGEKLRNLPEVRKLPGLTVFASGSYARDEASSHSDIDLFFLHTGAEKERPVSRLDEMRLFAKVIEIGEDLRFPTFSNDGEFLKIIYFEDLRERLGSREDDYLNYFTARMLLILESTPLVNENLYGELKDETIEIYFRDYPDHLADFQPVFLINDVLRFWKTLCLNYEHRRNRPRDNDGLKKSQHVKNFKLKFSRLLTCFGSIIAICAASRPVVREQMAQLLKNSPLDRFLEATQDEPDLKELRRLVIEKYGWFLEKTGLETPQLQELFGSREMRNLNFGNAHEFGDAVFEILEYFSRRNKYHRFLVI